MLKPNNEECINIENRIQDLLRNLFNVGYHTITTNTTTDPRVPIQFKVNLCAYNKEFSNYQYKNQSFVHFTSAESALEIINSLNHRLYNLYQKDDNQEYTYASKCLEPFHTASDSIIVDRAQEKNNIKLNTFILSATAPDNLELFWQQSYSNQGGGVGLEYEVCNNIDDCPNFFLGRVKYGEKEKFEQLRDGLSEISQMFPLCNIKLNLNQIIPFHKEPIVQWVNQKEVRLMTFSSDNHPIKIWKHGDDSDKKFIKIPLLGNSVDDELISTKVPILRLKRIILGPNLKDPTLKDELKWLAKNQFNYKVLFQEVRNS